MNRYKFMKLASQFLFVIIVIVCVFLLLLNFNIISLNSSDLPLVILLNQNEIGLKEGSYYQLEAIVFPNGTYHGKIVWSSSDESVAKVNETTGYVETFKAGEVIIKASVPLNNLESDCKISVMEEEVMLRNIQINNDRINLAIGGSYTVNYQLSPSNATMHDFEFTSSDTSVVVVNANGVVKAIGSGTAIITMKSKIADVKDTLLINVYHYSDFSNNKLNYLDNNGTYADEYVYYKTKSVSLSQNEVELEIGAKTKLTATVFPNNANPNINWSSSNSKVVSVDSNGVITGLQEGKANIIATSIDGITSICKVTVKNGVVKEESIDIIDSVLNLEVGQTKKVDYKLYLSNVGGSINWVSSNQKIASVLNGVITAHNEGSCIIKVVSSSSKYSDYITVNVNKPSNIIDLENLSFNSTTYTANINDTITLKPVLTPANATHRYLEWTTSNASIATVSNGVVTCKKAGTVVITASNGILSKDVIITIKDVNPSLITIENGESLKLELGEKRYLVKKIVPSNATNQKVSWTSSNTKIVSVNSNGLISAKSRGTAVVTVTTINGKKDKIVISVL